MTTPCSHIGLWSGYAEQHEPLIWDGYFYVLCLKLRDYTIGPRGVQVEHREEWKWLKERNSDEKQRQIVKWGRREKTTKGIFNSRETIQGLASPPWVEYGNWENKLRMVMKRPLSWDCCLYINIRMVLLLPDRWCRFLFLSWERICSTFCCCIIG